MTTKLILTNEVTGLGAAGDVVDVKDGYARNYLLPRGLATAWTKGGQRQLDQIRAARSKRAIATLEEAQSLKASLEAKPLVISERAGENGRLFGAVTSKEIAEGVRRCSTRTSTAAPWSSRRPSRRSASTRPPCDCTRTSSRTSSSRSSPRRPRPRPDRRAARHER